MKFTEFDSGNYGIQSLHYGHSDGRGIFESLQGELGHRDVGIKYTDDPGIVDIEKRPSFYPHIHLYQYKKNENQLIIFSQKLYVNDPLLHEFEKFLRENAVECAGAEDYSWIEPGFEDHWITPYTLVTCDYTRISMSRTRPVKNLALIENLGTADVFEGVDFDEPVTFRTINPETVEEKIRELEETGTYSVEISSVTELYHDRLLHFEFKEGFGSCSHFMISLK